MGCYGIGLGRLMGAVVEVNNDEKGIIWPKNVAPFLVHLIPIENNQKIIKTAEKLYQILSSCGGSTVGGQKEKIEVLYDDRKDKTAGEKFAEADLIGIPYRVVVSDKTAAKNSVEIKERGKKETKLVKISSLPSFLKKNAK
jgi:prolyl-tRNA synthetase